MRSWRLVLVGFGTVGRGVAERFRDARESFAELAFDPRIVAVIDPVVGSVVAEKGLDPATLVELADAGASLSEHPGASVVRAAPETLVEIDADIVVEVTPTNLEDGEPGLTHVRAALESGRHVITTNKGPVALAYHELRQLAESRGVALRFEGTVMSGTPILNLCDAGLAAAGIKSARGILSGTCNYILTEMESGRSYDQALAAAQEAGYAETDPSGDVEGWDAVAKVVILANHALGARLTLDQVDRTGITALSGEEIEAARAAARRWRLVASVTTDRDTWCASVRPQQLPESDPLAAVTGPDNLLLFDTDALGAVSVFGPGAGRGATGHAVIADLVAIDRQYGAATTPVETAGRGYRALRGGRGSAT